MVSTSAAGLDFGASWSAGSEKIGLLIAIVVLAIAFGSLVAMSLPIVVALVGQGVVDADTQPAPWKCSA